MYDTEHPFYKSSPRIIHLSFIPSCFRELVSETITTFCSTYDSINLDSNSRPSAIRGELFLVSTPLLKLVKVGSVVKHFNIGLLDQEKPLPTQRL